MGPASRQEVQNIVDTMRNRLLDRMVQKQDIQVLTDAVKTLVTINQQAQQLLKQAEYQRLQLTKRIAALEARATTLEQEVRAERATVARLLEQQGQPTSLDGLTPEQPVPAAPSYQQYVYRPT